VNQITNKGIGVVYLTVVKNPLLRRFASLQCLEHPFEVFFCFRFKGHLPSLHGVETHKNLGVVLNKPPHVDKGIDDLDAHLDGRLATKYGREHGHALLGKGVWEIFSVLAPTRF